MRRRLVTAVFAAVILVSVGSYTASAHDMSIHPLFTQNRCQGGHWVSEFHKDGSPNPYANDTTETAVLQAEIDNVGAFCGWLRGQVVVFQPYQTTNGYAGIYFTDQYGNYSNSLPSDFWNTPNVPRGSTSAIYTYTGSAIQTSCAGVEALFDYDNNGSYYQDGGYGDTWTTWHCFG